MANITTQLSRLIANVGGATASKRRLMMAVMESILLYSCKIWVSALNTEKSRKVTASVQRRVDLREAISYRTLSDPVVLVIAGVIPIDLLAP